MMRFSESFSFDVRLLPFDIRGSIAHARMLGAVGIITAEESRRLEEALAGMLEETVTGTTPADGAGAEDVHSYVENRLRARLGDLAGKLHTARSRNDQVALDLRMYLRHVSGEVGARLRELRRILIDRAREYDGAVMPGFTHLQPAQPVLLAHHLLAYEEMFRRDTGRFADAAARADELPLGAGALAGTTLPIDRGMVARELGFAGVSRNSLDTVSERDFPVEFSAAAALTMAHLSRLGEELALWSSPAYGFVILPDSLATGSSMMPQKKNPDIAELIRGKSGRVFGHLVSLLTMIKGLPLAYQRDLQEDKEALFDLIDTLDGCLAAASMLVAGIAFDRGRMLAAAGRGHTVATDLAEYLVARGMPFRSAHEVVGAVVRQAIAGGIETADLTLEELQRHSPLFDAGAMSLLTPGGSVAAKRSFGSTSPERVAGALEAAGRRLTNEEACP
jgi:argininosuccinate lyase